MKNKKNIKILLSVLIIILFSFALSFLISNFNVLKNVSRSERKDTIIDLSKITLSYFDVKEKSLVRMEGDYPYIEFEYAGKYIDKLIFNYEGSFDFSWSIDITGIDSYDRISSKQIKGESSTKINIFSEKIDMKVNTLKITFDGPITKISNVKTRNTLDMNKHVFVFLLLSMLTIYFLFKYKIYFSKNIEKAFILIAMISGILLIYCVPKITFISWDDETHFYRAYTLFQYPTIKWTESTNQMRTPFPFKIERINSNEEYEAVEYLFNTNHNYRNITTENKDNLFIEYQRYAYIPSAIALSLGRILNTSFTTLLSLGKLANLITYCVITYFAIKIIPCFKKLLVVIALLPSSIWLSTQYSCDTLITSCIFLSMAVFMYELYNKTKKLSLKNSLLFILPILLASFAKPIYIPLILLILFLPKEKFNGKNERIIFKLGIIGLLMMIMSTFVLPTLVGSSTFTDVRGSGANSAEQIHLIKNHPLTYLKVLYENAGKQFSNKLFSSTTLSSFSYMGEIASQNISYILLILLMFFTFTDQPKKKVLNKKHKFLIILCVLAIICMIWSSLYLGFTAVGSYSIQGVQWRYFIPLIFPLLICFCPFKIKNEISEIKYTQFLYYSSFVIILICIYLNIIKVIYI